MIDLHKLCRGTGWAVVESPHDTTNLVCQHGHIYAEGDELVAAAHGATPHLSRSLRALGKTIADGDFGELSVKFPATKFRQACRLLRPRQQSVLAAA